MHRARHAAIATFLLGLWVAAAGPPAGGAPRAPEPPGWVVDRVRFEPMDPGSGMSIAGIGDFRGVVDVVPNGGGVAVVNEVGLEDYLRGISEVPTSWPAEAQRAQAIAARTYALYEMGNRAGTAFRAAGAHICATQSCQVYVGLEKERRTGAAAWSAAVADTANQVVLYKGAPILAKYSSSNGGRTVAGGKPYLRAVDDPDDARSPHHRWQTNVALSSLTGLFSLPGEAVLARRVGDTVVMVWRTPDGVEGEHTTSTADFRARINGSQPAPPGLPMAVPSIRYDVETDQSMGVAVLSGGGWGHGVGMSQYGALGKALRGMRAPDILAAYYAGLRPTVVPQLPATIRVALATGAGQAAVGAPGRFRVLDGAGRPLAIIGNGEWKVVPAPKGVRVVPPPDQADAPVIQHVGFDPGAPRPGVPLVVRFRSSSPALVKLSVRAPSGETVPLEQTMVDPGQVVRTLPTPTVPGDYVVTIEAQAGLHRGTVVPVGFRVAPPRPDAVPPADLLTAARRRPAPRSAESPAGLVVALGALVAAATATGREVLRSRPVS